MALVHLDDVVGRDEIAKAVAEQRPSGSPTVACGPTVRIIGSRLVRWCATPGAVIGAAGVTSTSMNAGRPGTRETLLEGERAARVESSRHDSSRSDSSALPWPAAPATRATSGVWFIGQLVPAVHALGGWRIGARHDG